MDQKENIRNYIAAYFDKKGWENLPVRLIKDFKTGKKVPLFPKWEDGSKVSWSNETFTKETSLALTKSFNCTGIAIKTGKSSNLFILDRDHPLDVADKFLEENHIKIPNDTLAVQTQSNGIQDYFTFDADMEKISTTGAKIFGKNSPVDIRGECGLVFAVPSHVEGGGQYSFKNKGKLRPPPDELIKFLLKRASMHESDVSAKTEPASFLGKLPFMQGIKKWDDLTKDQKQMIKKAMDNAKSKKIGERSEAEFAFFCVCIQIGLNKETIKAIAMTFGKSKEQGLKYFEHTFQKASQRVQATNDSKPANFTNLAEAVTDGDIARMLLIKHDESIRYCYSQRSMYTYNGNLWVPDPEIPIQMVKGLRNDAEKAKQHVQQNVFDSKEKEKLSDHFDWLIGRVDNTASVKNILTAVQSEQGIPIKIDEFDRNVMKLNCQNGTLDLDKGELLPFNPDDLITKRSLANYNPASQCPQWLIFLDRIMAGDQTMIQFLQRAVGYSLTGKTDERCFFILFGSGANGKSVFIETILYLLNDYAIKTPADMLCKKQNGTIPNDVAALKGIRFACASETEQNARLNEAKIKELTGGSDTLVGCFKFKEFFSFVPNFKLWVATNHKPQIRETDPAIWDRVRLVPFDVRIPEAERDKNLIFKLQAECSGILNWCLAGLISWQQSGLQSPEKVLASTLQYKDDEDVFGLFTKDCCDVGSQYECLLDDIYKIYIEWAEKNTYHPLSKLRFSNLMTERGFPSGHNRAGSTKTGIAVKPEIDQEMVDVEKLYN